MGKTLSEEDKNKKAWDSNAITPGTPFMSLLASSLRYWVVYKMNTDPGWKDVRRCVQPLCIVVHELTVTTLSFKSSYRMRVFPVKENTRSWISFGVSGATLVTTRTHIMLFMVWYVLTVSCV